MSATNRGSEREPYDTYATPAWTVVRLLEELELPGGKWLEPCAGEGAIVNIVSSLRSDVSWNTVEIRPECEGNLQEIPTVQSCKIGNFLEDSSTPTDYSVLFTNPPYNCAIDFVKRGLEVADHVVMLLRLNFIASKNRQPFMRENPPDVYVLSNRPSFKGKGKTDATEYCWMHWQRRLQGSLRRDSGIIKVLNLTDKFEKGEK